MNSQTIPIILNLVAALFGAFGQYFYKGGAAKLRLVPIVQNVPLILGVLSFVVVMGLFVASYRLGGRISVVYPVYATTFLWATAIEIFLEKSPVTILHFVGIALVMLGVSLIAMFSNAH